MSNVTASDKNNESTPALEDDEVINFSLKNVKMTHNVNEASTLGSLYVTNKHIFWISEETQESTSHDLSINITNLILHAISNDERCYPKPCLYCQFNNEKSDDEENSTDIYIIPEDSHDVKNLFDAFSHAALLNPDEEALEADDCYYSTSNDEIELTDEQMKKFVKLDSIFENSNPDL